MSSPAWQGLAADIGASSGRVMLGSYDGKKLACQEVHRFGNEPVARDGALRWDFQRLLGELKAGIRKGLALAPSALSFGIDTWGVDYGLLDAQGRLLADPVHYRDPRHDGRMAEAFAKVPKAEIFARTGVQFLPFNTAYQLMAEKDLGRASRLLMMPDLFAHALCGSMSAEFTNASTTQLLDPRSRGWDFDLIGRLGLPKAIFPPILAPGSSLGTLPPELGSLKFVAVATHDTGSAVAAVPAAGPGFAYLVCGTWSLLGIESGEAETGPEAAALNLTSEGGVFGTWRVLKNCMGLWILQELKRQWDGEGRNLGWPELEALAASAPAFAAFIDPDDPAFMPPGNMAGRIRDYLSRTRQAQPQGESGLLRCVLESLALKYRLILRGIAGLRGGSGAPKVLHMVGGGIQNRLLRRFTAGCCGIPVVAGPVEASALGNLGMQLVAAGRVKSLAALRALIAASTKLEREEPGPAGAWDAAAQRFDVITKTEVNPC